MIESFPSLLARLIEERFPSRRAFARAAEPERDENTAQAYLAGVLKGRRPPPLDRIDNWATALCLAGRPRQHFLDLAMIEHLPPAARPRFLALLAADERNEALETRLRAAESGRAWDGSDEDA